jgi:hypothetical protein
MSVPSQGHYGFHSFPVVDWFVCLYNYEFWLSLCKIVPSRFHYGSKVPAVTITVFKYRNKIGKIVVKAVPYSGEKIKIMKNVPCQCKQFLQVKYFTGKNQRTQ